MHLKTLRAMTSVFALAGATIFSPGAAFAQSSPEATTPDNGDIIVTARKRQESILKVPVVLTAVTGEQLTTTQVTTVTDLPRLVPGLVIAGNLLSIGPQVTIRGVGTSSFDPGVDHAVEHARRGFDCQGRSLNCPGRGIIWPRRGCVEPEALRHRG